MCYCGSEEQNQWSLAQLTPSLDLLPWMRISELEWTLTVVASNHSFTVLLPYLDKLPSLLASPVPSSLSTPFCASFLPVASSDTFVLSLMVTLTSSFRCFSKYNQIKIQKGKQENPERNCVISVLRSYWHSGGPPFLPSPLCMTPTPGKF